MAGIGGLTLLTSLPLAQYFVLRDHVRRPALWIPINIAAWLLGIAWTLAPSPVVDQSTPAGALILIYVSRIVRRPQRQSERERRAGLTGENGLAHRGESFHK